MKTILCENQKEAVTLMQQKSADLVLLCLTDSIVKGFTVLKSIRDKNYREARRAYLVGYDRSVPRLRQASHCTGCGQCMPHCPQRIDIPGELRRIDAYVEKLKQDRL